MKRSLWGLLLAPLCYATFSCLPEFLFSLRAQVFPILWLGMGAVAYAMFEALFNRPMRTYVFGHELTHALAGIAVGSKVHSFKVSKKGGSVSLSKSNFFIALAPYCLPLYTLFIVLLYAGFKYFYPFPYLVESAQFGVGATLAFHISLTIYAVQQRQPDIHKTGLFFSAVFILLVNAWVLVLLAKVLFWEAVSLKEFSLRIFQSHNEVWIRIIQAGYDGTLWVLDRVQSLRSS